METVEGRDASTSRRWRGLVLVLALLAGAVSVFVLAATRNDAGADAITIGNDAENPLRGQVHVRLAEPAAVSVTVVDGTGSGFVVTTPGKGEDLVIPVLGLRPETDYTVTVSADGDVLRSERLRSGALPDSFPPLRVDQTQATEVLTLFDSTHTSPRDSEDERDLGHVVVVDGGGHVVWYETFPQPVGDVQRTERGTLLVNNDELGAIELDMTGARLAEWSGVTGLEVHRRDEWFGRPTVGDDATRVETDQLHHEVTEVDGGNLLTLSREVRTVGYAEPICEHEEDDPFDGSYEVASDTVVEFRPDGSILSEMSLFDLVDPLGDLERIHQAEFCSPYLSERYPDGEPVRDWTHANAVVLDESRNAVIVSARHMDALYAIRYADDEHGPAGELLWTLGEAGDFVLEGPGEWFFHQHAPEVQDDGSILLYDNGNRRPGRSLDEPARLPYSRAVRYELDEDRMVARQAWEHHFPPRAGVYAPYAGDADRTPEGTVLIVHGGLTEPLSHSPDDPSLLLWARLIEVDEPSGEIVFDLSVRDPAGLDDWRIYRAERIPSLYPPEYGVALVRRR